MLMVYLDCCLLIKVFVFIILYKVWRFVSVIYDEIYGQIFKYEYFIEFQIFVVMFLFCLYVLINMINWIKEFDD